MRKRAYGKTGTSVSEIGFGAWQLGNAKDWGNMQTSDAIALVHAAIDLGCNFFDTAPGYGHGKSEAILGEALKDRRHEVVINTKVGHTADGTSDFSPAGIRNSVLSSLKRLGTDYLDSVLLHNPAKELMDGDSPQFNMLRSLKQEGLIGAYGLSIDTAHEMLHVIENTDTEVMEILFNIFHQDTRDAFTAAQNNSIALIVKVPLDSGWLSGKYHANSQFEGIRKRWSQADVQRRAELVEDIRFIEKPGVSLTQSALQFILAHQEISTVIPGIKNIEQLHENLGAATEIMPEHIVAQLHDFWERELKTNPVPW